jgi:fructose-bisphosphate aldolase class 1
MIVDHSMVVASVNAGIASADPAATVRIGNSTVAHNVTGVVALGGSTMQSFKNNQISSNITDGTPITAVPGGPQD